MTNSPVCPYCGHPDKYPGQVPSPGQLAYHGLSMTCSDCHRRYWIYPITQFECRTFIPSEEMTVDQNTST